ncbi:MAG: dienelactone hydrolase family protein [Acidimicrobiia bacterium]
MTFLDVTTDGPLRRREFDLDRNGRLVSGVLWEPAEPTPAAPLVLLGHGASGDRHQLPLPWLAQRLTGEHGCFALAIDGPVHGRRFVPPGGRESFWPEWQREGTVTDMVDDWRFALDFAQSLPEVGAGPVGYWGLSMGTIYGAPFVAAEERVTAAVLGLMGIVGPAHYVPTITAAAEQITCPVLFLMQLEDELFNREQYLALFDKLATRDKRLHANPGLHPQVPVEELHHSIEFLLRRLRGEITDASPTFTVSN